MHYERNVEVVNITFAYYFNFIGWVAGLAVLYRDKLLDGFSIRPKMM